MVEHHIWLVGEMIERASKVDDAVLDRPIEINVDGVPHHSQAPRRVALALAAAVALGGAWFASRSTDDAVAQAADRKRLIARREKLLNELARLEQDHRAGRVDDRRYGPRREELVTFLEGVYSALDSSDAGPDPADRAGVAA